MSIVKLSVEDREIELEVKEFRGQRVVTLRDVDSLHKRADGTASNNIQNNKKYFLEGEDYFIVKPNQKEEFNFLQIPNRGLILLTESGYLMLIKSFTDKLAWKVQRQMVNAYFKAKEIVAQHPQNQPNTIEDILISALTSMKEMKFENSELKKAVRHLEVVVDNEIWINDHQKADIQQTVRSRVGLLKSEGLDAHFQSIFTALNTYFNVPKYDKIPRKDFEQAMNFVKGWYPKRKTTSE